MITTIENSGILVLCGTLVACCLFSAPRAYGWQQQYSSEESNNGSRQIWRWDSERQPGYNDILAERINASLYSPAHNDTAAGADISLGKNISAFAIISQAEGVSATKEDYHYLLGVSVHF